MVQKMTQGLSEIKYYFASLRMSVTMKLQGLALSSILFHTQLFIHLPMFIFPYLIHNTIKVSVHKIPNQNFIISICIQ